MVKIQVNSQGKAYLSNAGKVLVSSGGSTPNIESLNVTPTTSSQTITVSGNVDGYSPINVAAVTSAIDSNIIAANIKKDVTILGITGSYEGSGSGGIGIPREVKNGVYQIPTESFTFSLPSGVTSIGSYGLYYSFYNCRGLTGSIDLSGIISIGNYGLSYTFYGCTGLTGSIDLSGITTILDNSLNGTFYTCTGISSIDLSSVTSIGTYGLYQCFYGCTGLTGSIDLSNVTRINGTGLSRTFYNCTGITSVDLSSVTGVAASGLSYTFYGCTGLTSVDLSSVTAIAISGFSLAFYNCKKLQTISFDSLTTTSFGNVNAFNNMFSNTTGSEAIGGCTVHFPSNLQSTISGLTGYPTFGGSSSYITLSFDLPATS